jgi:crotonobetaine/carnitine-CoA ligase
MRSVEYTDFAPTFGEFRDWSLPAVLRQRAAQYPDRRYLTVPAQDTVYTYAQTLDTAERIGRSFVAYGGRPGDRVAIMASNRAEVILAWFGSALAGMVEVPINTAYRGSFLEHQIRTVGPRFAVIDATHAQAFVDGGDATSMIERYFLVGAEEDVAAASTLLDAAGRACDSFDCLLDEVDVALPSVSSTDLASVFFTSGTTGLSKGVMMTHAHMYFFADECVCLTRLTHADVYLSVGPLFHGNAQFLAAYPALIAGAEFVLIERFSASRWIDQIRDSRATVTNFVGVMMDFVWKQPARDNDSDNDLRTIFAAPTAWTIHDAFKERFGVENFVEVFGLTETCMPIMTPIGSARPAGAAGVGVSDWFDIRLVDPVTDLEVEVGQVGELTVRPKVPWITTVGYFGMPEKTLEAFRNLWFHTGDALRKDADGWYYFVDRFKDAIRRRGENISSYEVEQAVLASDLVLECAAVAVPADTEAGEDEVLLAVVPVPGTSLDADELWQWCERRLPAFAMPRYIRLVDELPKTPSAKVQKNEIRAWGTGEGVFDRQVDRV